MHLKRRYQRTMRKKPQTMKWNPISRLKKIKKQSLLKKRKMLLMMTVTRKKNQLCHHRVGRINQEERQTKEQSRQKEGEVHVEMIVVVAIES